MKTDPEPMESSMDTLKEEVRQLKEALTEKEEQLSRAVKSRQMKTADHLEALAELNTAEASLKENELKCASLEETLQNQQEMDKRHIRELTKHETHKLLMVDEEFQRKLEKQKERFEEEKEALREQLFQEQKMFNKQLQEEESKYDVKLSAKEASLEQQLLAQDELFNSKLAEVNQRWEGISQMWIRQRDELVQNLQESQRLRQEEKEKSKQDLQRLNEVVLQLELQVTKKEKKRKCFCRWLWGKMKFWKKN